MKHIHVIQHGTVIDHIPQGIGMKISNLLTPSNSLVMIGLNLDSKRLGKKDLLKYADKKLNIDEIKIAATLAPNCTLSEISFGNVKDKGTPLKPAIIENIFTCQNPKCITNNEVMTTKFHTSPVLRCFYCERSVSL